MCLILIRGDGISFMQRITNEKGYTLIESILHLAIVSLLFFMTVAFLEWYAEVNRQIKDINEASWQQFSVDFQREIRQVQMVYPQSYHDQINFLTDRGRITIDYRSGVLRKRIDGAGHIPLLTNLKRHQLKVEDEYVTVSVTFSNGLEKEGKFIFGVYE